MARTVIIMMPNQVNRVDDVHKFSTEISIKRLMELIKEEEERGSAERIADIKMNRFKEAYKCTTNVNAAGSLSK